MVLVHFRKKLPSEKSQYCNDDAVKRLIYYILCENKMPNHICGAIGASIESRELAIKQFLAVKKVYRNTKGKQVFHFWVSFDNAEKYSNKVYRHIGYEITKFFNGQYQIVFALHENTENPHIHFVVNTVNFMTGKKLRWKRGDRKRLENFVNKTLLHLF